MPPQRLCRHYSRRHRHYRYFHPRDVAVLEFPPSLTSLAHIEALRQALPADPAYRISPVHRCTMRHDRRKRSQRLTLLLSITRALLRATFNDTSARVWPAANTVEDTLLSRFQSFHGRQIVLFIFTGTGLTI